MDDLVGWAEVSEQEPPRVDLVAGARVPDLAGLPDPRLKKPRHRPNKGRKRRFIGPYLEEPPWEMLRATGYPVPTHIENLDRVPPCWRRGPRYETWRLRVRGMWGTTCHICGHGEAYTSDHLIPLSKWGNQPYMPELSRPAHGIEGCPTCQIKCNSSRGNREFAMAIRDYKPRVGL